MRTSYFVQPISSQTMEMAFPLANAAIPILSKYEWMQLCHCSSVPEGGCAARREREEIVTARNTQGYVKGICVYAIRDHRTYGRIVDVPLFIALSAVDGEGVVEELIDFLMGKCDVSICCGIRFWNMNHEIWRIGIAPVTSIEAITGCSCLPWRTAPAL